MPIPNRTSVKEAVGGKGGAVISSSMIALTLLKVIEYYGGTPISEDLEAEMAIVLTGLVGWVMGMVPTLLRQAGWHRTAEATQRAVSDGVVSHDEAAGIVSEVMYEASDPNL